MKNIVVACCLVLASATAIADVYKCKDASGKIDYQATPCSIGAQSVIDDSRAKWQRTGEKPPREPDEKEKAAKLQRDNAVANSERRHKANVVKLRACVKKNAECNSTDYISYLMDLYWSPDVEAVFGEPRTQNFGGQKIIYYSIPLFEGKSFRTARIQISFDGDYVKQVNVY